MSTRSSLSSCSVAIAVLCWSMGAPAEGKSFPECTRRPTENDVAEAKGAFEAGQLAFEEADYDRAIVYWEEAFRRDCTAAALLLNLSRAYELSGRIPEAIVSIETYLTRRPADRDDDRITRRLETLRRKQEADTEDVATPTTLPSARSTEDVPPAAPRGDTARRPNAAPLWPLFIAGGGLAIGVVGGTLWAVNQSVINQCHPGTSGELICLNEQIRDEAQSAQTPRNVGIGLTVGGAAVAIGGTVTYFVLRNRTSERTILSPDIGPGYAGLSYAGSF